MTQIKIFGNYRYQSIEEEFNRWAMDERPFIVKSIMAITPVPRNEVGHSLYFTLVVFYKTAEQPTSNGPSGSKVVFHKGEKDD